MAWLEKIYIEKGPQAARVEFQRFYPDSRPEFYRIFHSDEGVETVRVDVDGDADGITYQDFTPGHWEIPYVILKARFEYRSGSTFLYHQGAEMLVPISGAISYSFAFSEGGSEETGPADISLRTCQPVSTGDLISINPGVPHRTTATDGNGATAWMIFRHSSDSGANISFDAPRGTDRQHLSIARRVTMAELENPGKYGSIAWGISEKIRFARQRANMTVSLLAKISGIDPSLLSRIEAGGTNISLDSLARISEILRLDFSDLIPIAPWCYQLYSRSSNIDKTLGEEVDSSGLLFACVRNFEKARSVDAKELLCMREAPAAWIVLSGRILCELRTGSSGATRAEVLVAGSVLHFRRDALVSVDILETVEFVEFCCPPQNAGCSQ